MFIVFPIFLVSSLISESLCLKIANRDAGVCGAKGLSKNYVVKNVGMNPTRFSGSAETLFSSESN